MNAHSRLSPSAFREIEAALSLPLFEGVEMGHTLNDPLANQLVDGLGDWRRRTAWINRARMLRHQLVLGQSRVPDAPSLNGRILMTWEKPTPRFDELLRPVLQHFEDDEAVVFYGNPALLPLLPERVPSIGWNHMPLGETRSWRNEYRRCRPEWKRTLETICRRLNLPRGAFEVLSLSLLLASKRVAACLQFFRNNRPSVILTEFDRNYLWSCVVLAARQLGIPTVTLVHGVMRQDALGFSPVLADVILCWGESDQKKLIAAGEPPERIAVGGCPRLTRELRLTAAESREKMALDLEKPVVMFATSSETQSVPLAEMFCQALETANFATGIVRLHPSEKLATYANLASRYPRIRFMENQEMSLDESLAATDIVVVRSSGVGSDALVKRRPVVVLNPESDLIGHDQDLVEEAGCLHVRTTGQLAEILRRLVLDRDFQAQQVAAAEQYSLRFCRVCGDESAQRIVEIVRQIADSDSFASVGTPRRLLSERP